MKNNDDFREANNDLQYSYIIGVLFILLSILLAGCISDNDKAIDKKVNMISSEFGPVPLELRDNLTYKNILSNLSQDGYAPSGGSITFTLNGTRFDYQFSNSDGKNATISALFRNETFEEVYVKKDEDVSPGWYVGIILLIILICLCLWAGYRYYLRPGASPNNTCVEEIRAPVDVLNDTIRMLAEAEREFGIGRVKEGYTLAGQALRFFISNSCGSGASETSEEIVSLSQKAGKQYQEVQDILNRCTLVEFAKNEGNTEEFAGIVTSIRLMIREHRPQECSGSSDLVQNR